MDTTSASKKSPRFGKWLIGGTLGIVAAFAAFVMFSTPPNEKMISHAERIAPWQRTKLSPSPMPGFNPGMSSAITGYSMILDHHWLPDGTLLRTPFTFNQKGSFSIQLERLDAKTGLTISNKPLSLNSIQKSTLEEPRISPDGKWMFLEDSGEYALIDANTAVVRRLHRDLYGKEYSMIVAATRGSNMMWQNSVKPGAKQARSARNSSLSNMAHRVAWMPDSKSFLEIWNNAATKKTTLRLRSLEDKQLDEVELPFSVANQLPKLLGVTSNGEAMIADQTSFSFYVTEYYLIDIKTKKITTLKFKNIPQGLLIKQIELSPDGKRLLWKTVNVNPDPARTIKLMMDQMVFRRDLQFRVNLKVSDLDGGNMHEICGEMLSGKQEDGFQMAHWMPGGKKISFWYKDAVYAVPAE